MKGDLVSRLLTFAPRARGTSGRRSTRSHVVGELGKSDAKFVERTGGQVQVLHGLRHRYQQSATLDPKLDLVIDRIAIAHGDRFWCRSRFWHLLTPHERAVPVGAPGLGPVRSAEPEPSEPERPPDGQRSPACSPSRCHSASWSRLESPVASDRGRQGEDVKLPRIRDFGGDQSPEPSAGSYGANSYPTRQARRRSHRFGPASRQQSSAALVSDPSGTGSGIKMNSPSGSPCNSATSASRSVRVTRRPTCQSRSAVRSPQRSVISAKGYRQQKAVV